MTPRSFLLTPELSDYVRANSEAPDDVAADLLAETAELGERGEVPATFQIAQEQGAFMTLLTRALGVRRAIEIGTFTGFSALCVARGMPDDGRLICLDVSEKYTAVARRYWDRAGVADRIELRIGDAHETLRALPAEPAFDLAFVDADGAFDEDESGWPGGDLDVFADDGLPAAELRPIVTADDLWADEMVARIAGRLGFADELAAAVSG